MSYHPMHPDELWTRYMSTGGELNPQQPELLRGAMEKLSKGAVVLLAFDNDEGGGKIAAEVKAIAPAGRELRRVVLDVGKDWNEMLKNQLGLA
ncbi:MAG: toprim domain-containing protein [Syntrophobacteraceae bacterium]|nr:toprim domain-containing protein [Syntrophobacteraceae bacterium]